jgi:hypothetical protein
MHRLVSLAEEWYLRFGRSRDFFAALIADSEVIAVRFSVAMLEWFDELQRDFVLKHGGVVFV